MPISGRNTHTHTSGIYGKLHMPKAHPNNISLSSIKPNHKYTTRFFSFCIGGILLACGGKGWQRPRKVCVCAPGLCFAFATLTEFLISSWERRRRRKTQKLAKKKRSKKSWRRPILFVQSSFLNAVPTGIY